MLSPPAPTDVLPPVSPRTAARVAAVGAGLCGLATLLALVPFDDAGGPLGLSTGRLLLVAVGALTAGGALSWRPDLHWMWLIAAGTAALASLGLPEPRPGDWDSARMLARVLAGGAAAGAILTRASAQVRYALLSVFALYHFGGILTAVTWPDTNGTSPPWVTTQSASRLYIPYFKFLYLSNAYHFYSPEPGPASHLFLLLSYELKSATRPEKDLPTWTEGRNADTGAAEWTKAASEWVDVPNRRDHYKDPLGLTYYRRLSVTEMVSQALPSRFAPGTFEKNDAVMRRQGVAVGLGLQVPLDPRAGPFDLQYRIPRADIVRYLLPSYARHVAYEFSGPGRTADGAAVSRRVVGVKVFRVEHSILPVDEFHGRRLPFTTDKWTPPGDPYHPTTYKPYYLGEYDAAGTLLNPTDPMLYWLCPILPKAASVSDPKGRDFEDFMSKYAGFEFEWERRAGQ